MGHVVFENQLFDHWLNQKSQEILSKMDKEKVTTEDMLILTLKALTNHFHHMDVEFRDEFKKIDSKFEILDKNISAKFEEAEKKTNHRFDRLYTTLMWGFGMMATMTFGLYIKLFLG
jgi:hypothetical protein